MTGWRLNILFGVLILAAAPSRSFGQARMASGFGEATLGGQRVFVHVTVAVPPGRDGKGVVEDAVRGQGARPIQPAEFVLTGFKWPQFDNGNAAADEVVQHYNSANDVVEAYESLTNSQDTWNDVTSSKFWFTEGAATTACPSLVKECPGPQLFDGSNDVGWAALSGCCTLGVTWFGTSNGAREADMALSTRFAWTTEPGGSGYDVETVFLHENGHVLGLGHSTVSGSVMEAYYAGEHRDLSLDDERGVTYLYPAVGAVGSISGIVKTESSTPISGAKVSIANLPISATTAGDGTYSLNGIPTLGSYDVTASATGFQSSTLPAFVPGTVVFTLKVNTSGGGGGGGGCKPKGPFACP